MENESKMVVLQTKDTWAADHKIDVLPFGNLSLSPAATILNYGQGIFEGIKAHRTAKGRIVVFRPDQNSVRFSNGAFGLSMPVVPHQLFLNALSECVIANAHLVPPEGEGALYLRPILFGSGGHLGLSPSPGYHFLIYAAPVGQYFKGVKGGARMKIETEHSRAAIQGCGTFKAGGNYAPCFKWQNQARKEGYTDIIYFDNCNQSKAEEVACANLFLVQKNKIVTPELGTILPGITRASILQLARDLSASGDSDLNGRTVVEQDVTQEDFAYAQEAFCTGTATVISPIEHISIKNDPNFSYDYDYQGPVLTKLKSTLVDIQSENKEDTYGWVRNPFDKDLFCKDPENN